MERVIRQSEYGDIACNDIIIYSNTNYMISKKTKNTSLAWTTIKPKYYKYKDDDCLIEVWYDGKGIVLDNGLNKFLEIGYISNSWSDEKREEISYEQAMQILEQKEQYKNNCDYISEPGFVDISKIIENSNGNLCCEIAIQKQNNNGGASDCTPDYYGAKCKCGEKIDAYTVCDKYAKPHKGSAWHHAVKKLLRAGDGHKALEKDIDEVIDSLKRWKEQINSQTIEKE